MGQKPQKREPADKRNADGTFAAGNNANPGGLSREARAMRAAFGERAEKALALVDDWLVSGEFPKEQAAVKTVFERWLGVPGKPSELPSLTPPPAAQPADTASLLENVRSLLGGAVAGLKQKHEAGELGPEDVGQLAKVAHSLGELQKAEKEAGRASDLSKLTTAELIEMVLAHLPADKVREALAKAETVRP